MKSRCLDTMLGGGYYRAAYGEALGLGTDACNFRVSASSPADRQRMKSEPRPWSDEPPSTR
jgi:hypothetical protein